MAIKSRLRAIQDINNFAFRYEQPIPNFRRRLTRDEGAPQLTTAGTSTAAPVGPAARRPTRPAKPTGPGATWYLLTCTNPLPPAYSCPPTGPALLASTPYLHLTFLPRSPTKGPNRRSQFSRIDTTSILLTARPSIFHPRLLLFSLQLCTARRLFFCHCGRGRTTAV